MRSRSEYKHAPVHARTRACYLSQARLVWQMGVPDDEHHQICVAQWKPLPIKAEGTLRLH